MDCISSVEIRKVVVMSAAQVGKTDMCILNLIGFYIHFDPAPIMVIQPTITMAETFSKKRLAPMLRDTPVLREKVDESRGSGNTVLEKSFPGGYVTMIGSNSPNSLASRPVKIILADELDRYPDSAGEEGDPLSLAEERQRSFWDKKTVITSTPTIKGLSRIEKEYKHSSQGVWNVPCPACGAYQPLEWESLVYDEKNLNTIRYACKHCGAISTESQWKARYKEGKYVHKYPHRKIKGFYLNAMASLMPGAEWAELVEKYLKAKEDAERGDTEMLKTWTNTTLGLPFEEENTQIEFKDLLSRREKYGAELPEEVRYITAGVDTQDDRFEIEIVGWGKGKESWSLAYIKKYGDLKKPEIWNELDQVLSRVFTKKDGTKMIIGTVCMDTGGHFANEVYQFCKEREGRGVWAIKGGNKPGAPYISKESKNNRYRATLFILGVDTGKSLLYDRLRLEQHGPGYCHFPDLPEYDEYYFKGLTAEKKIVDYKKGMSFYKWVLRDSGFKRNEPLDLRVYATAALEIAQPDLSAEQQKAAPKKGRRKRGGFKA